MKINKSIYIKNDVCVELELCIKVLVLSFFSQPHPIPLKEKIKISRGKEVNHSWHPIALRRKNSDPLFFHAS